jgi:hypothetical protein
VVKVALLAIKAVAGAESPVATVRLTVVAAVALIAAVSTVNTMFPSASPESAVVAWKVVVPRPVDPVVTVCEVKSPAVKM